MTERNQQLADTFISACFIDGVLDEVLSGNQGVDIGAGVDCIAYSPACGMEINGEVIQIGIPGCSHPDRSGYCKLVNFDGTLSEGAMCDIQVKCDSLEAQDLQRRIEEAQKAKEDEFPL